MSGLTSGELAQLIGLILTVGSVPTIIAFLLNRKGANKKLELEEGGLGVDRFNAQTGAYEKLLDRQSGIADEAIKALASYKAERKDLMDRIKNLEEADDDKTRELDDTNHKLELLRKLFNTYTARVGVPLTQEEQAIFEATKPMRRRASTSPPTPET